MKQIPESTMTEKKIEDYLHLYKKCPVMVMTEVDNGHTSFVLSVHENGNVQVAHARGSQDKWQAKYLKPILRPLSDMKEYEIVECAKISNCLPTKWELQQNHSVNKLDHPNEGIQVLVADKYAFRITVSGQIYFYNYNNPNAAIYAPKTPEVIMYLLSKHFDLFGLIESGIAIDKTKTIKSETD